ncbi:MAG: S9 family peptidase, partial [Prevotellaceae bacterium]|nr:S9 family peptidase [Prevotellaceae bacterium]
DYKTGSVVETLFSTDQTNNGGIKKIEKLIWSDDDAQVLIFAGNHYHLYDVKRRQIELLTEQPNPLFPTFSPDGRMIAFVSNNNLYIKKMDFSTEIAITKDGEQDAVNNGAADELYRTGFGTEKAFEWSADSKLLAFIRFDYKDVAPYRFALNPNDSVPAIVGNRYAPAGGNITKTGVYVYDIFYRTTKKMNVPENEEQYIPVIRWSQSSERLAVAALNRFQNTLSLYFANPASTVASLALQEKSDSFVDYRILDFLTFLPENKFVIASERDGFRHLYLYAVNGTQEKQLTSGNWEVTKFLGYNAAKKTFYYQSNEVNPLQRDIYSLNTSGKKLRLTDGKGTHDAEFSANHSYFMNYFSSLHQPETVTLRSENGNVVREMKNDDILVMRASNNKEFFTVSSLNGYLLKPAGFNPNKKYPVVLIQSDILGTQQVLDKWTFGWENALADEGYIVARVDGRGSSGRGAEFARAPYWNLGQKESEDQITAAKYLASLPYVDAKNISLYGEEAGGYIALRSLADGAGVFKSAVAVSPITDWSHYSAAVSERYLRTPKANANGYKQASLTGNVGSENIRPLLMHNTADMDIHLQHTLEYAGALSEADKLFNMQLYTSKNRHFYRTILEFLK